jgi:hypothetical protein
LSSANWWEEGKLIVRRGMYRRQVFLFLVLLLGLLGCTASVVAYFDPLWCTGITHEANRITPVIDARLQKTSRLIRGHNDYDALVMGSSRVEQFRQKDFAPLRVFNYAFPSVYPDEYEDYLDLFLRYNRGGARLVFLGLDFYGTNVRAFEHARPPSYYIGTCVSPFYPLRTFISGDALHYALRMARKSNDIFSYDRLSLDKITKVVSREESDRLRQEQLDHYGKTNYGDYVYNPDYHRILQNLKERHPDLRFVVFTTPETVDLFRVLIAKGRFGDYERWLKDVVDVFGAVYNLMPPGSYTADRRNFLDAHHLYPDKAVQVVRILTGHPLHGDQAVAAPVTRETVAIYLAENRQKWQQQK